MSSTSSTSSLARAALAAFALLAGAQALGLFNASRALLALPGLCLFHRVTGLDCPGCGMTRAFAALLRGDLGAAEALHPFSGPLLLGCVLLALLPRQRSERLIRSSAAAVAGSCAVALLLGWWAAARIAPWLA